MTLTKGSGLNRLSRLAAMAICGALLASCQVELSRRDHWAEKAKQFQQAAADRPRGAITAPDSTAGPASKLRVTSPDGSVTLNSFLPEHLVNHLRTCIIRGESELIFDELLSDAAKQAYEDESRDPHDAVDWLMHNDRDVIILLNRMTNGLSSPDVSWESRGETYRMQLLPSVRTALRFTTLDMIREDGQFKLLLIS